MKNRTDKQLNKQYKRAHANINKSWYRTHLKYLKHEWHHRYDEPTRELFLDSFCLFAKANIARLDGRF